MIRGMGRLGRIVDLDSWDAQMERTLVEDRMGQVVERWSGLNVVDWKADALRQSGAYQQMRDLL